MVKEELRKVFYGIYKVVSIVIIVLIDSLITFNSLLPY